MVPIPVALVTDAPFTPVIRTASVSGSSTSTSSSTFTLMVADGLGRQQPEGCAAAA
jgi:hypothetical protein